MAKYIIDLQELAKQAAAAKANADKLGVTLYFALKSCPLTAIFPVLGEYVTGVTASGLNEARLGAKADWDVHVHSPAYRAEDIPELCELCSTIVFNSFNQYDRFASEVEKRGRTAALRINPGFSASSSWKYDPCSKYSRYGERLEDFERIGTLQSIHLHALCEADGDQFATLVEHLCSGLAAGGGRLLSLRTINLGGGMQISDPEFATSRAIAAVAALKKLTGAEILIEPSEYVVCDAGFLESEVLDVVVRDDKQVAILDCSAACHMPDVINMPYVPDVVSPAQEVGSGKGVPTILAGNTCLSADVIGEYAFAKPLAIGDHVVFGGMGAYTFCQASTFNGIPMPTIIYQNMV